MVSLSEIDDGGKAELRVGETLIIRLSEAAGGGYQWEPDRLDTAMLQLENVTRDARAPASSVGSSVDAVVTLKACAPGRSELVLKHWRHWEGDASIVGRFRLEVVVHP